MPETRRLKMMAADQEIRISSDDSPSDINMDAQTKKLRQRSELASILNFFQVFEPVIQCQLKITAEEIEAGLIVPNDFLAKLHIVLLKGVTPASRLLNVPDAWVPVMSKKLALAWPWVAEGDFPLTASKGEELKKYKELDPADRLYILKALCELRADREDILTFINENIKNGTELSTLRKEKLGEDGKGTVYWYDGDEDIGQRLYKEIRKFGPKATVKARGNPLGIISQWETLATNFEEFQKVVSEFSSSKVKLEVAVAKALQEDVIPALEKVQKKKEALLKRQRKEERLLAAFNSARTRTGRTRKPVNYRYEEYDKAIKEAIEVQQHGKIVKDQNDSDSSDDEAYDSSNEQNNEAGNINRSSENMNSRSARALRRSEKQTGALEMNTTEGVSLTTKQRLRQQPNANTAIEPAIVIDWDEENSSKDTNKRIRTSGSSTEVAGDTENDDFSS